jgi:hypothetical protein
MAEEWMQAFSMIAVDTAERFSQMNKYDRTLSLMEATTITPSLAQSMLDRNMENNRSISPNRVIQYANAMAEGKFLLNGETIKFDRKGQLIDGQHRLLACVRSGTSFQAFVVRDLDHTVFSTIDIGRKRSIGDALHHMGASNSKMTAAALRWVLAIQADQVFNNHWDSMSEDVVDFWTKNRIIDRSVAICNLKTVRRLVVPALAVALHFLFAKKCVEEADAFFAILNDGGARTDDPVMIVRERLIRELGSSTQKKTGKQGEIMAAWLINAWNSKRGGRPLKTVKGPIVDDSGNPSLPRIA